MRKRFSSRVAGSADNFDAFRKFHQGKPVRGGPAASTIGLRKRYVLKPRVPKVSHVLKTPKSKPLIQKMFQSSKARQLIASEIVEYLIKNPSATRTDILADICSKLTRKGLVVDYKSQSKVPKVFTQPVTQSSIDAVYSKLISKEGFIEKK
ncbi:MAG TPA: hypothetical protein PKK60_03440 [archaeon]|nr:hypothetical protein [archaeon]